MRPRPGVAIAVSHHARERARARFPGFKAARIIDEVRAALLEGRLSATKPAGCGGDSGSHALYAWTPDGARVYALRAHADAFVVVTALAAGGQGEQAGGS